MFQPQGGRGMKGSSSRDTQGTGSPSAHGHAPSALGSVAHPHPPPTARGDQQTSKLPGREWGEPCPPAVASGSRPISQHREGAGAGTCRACPNLCSPRANIPAIPHSIRSPRQSARRSWPCQAQPGDWCPLTEPPPFHQGPGHTGSRAAEGKGTARGAKHITLPCFPDR